MQLFPALRSPLDGAKPRKACRKTADTEEDLQATVKKGKKYRFQVTAANAAGRGPSTTIRFKGGSSGDRARCTDFMDSPEYIPAPSAPLLPLTTHTVTREHSEDARGAQTGAALTKGQVRGVIGEIRVTHSANSPEYLPRCPRVADRQGESGPLGARQVV